MATSAQSFEFDGSGLRMVGDRLAGGGGGGACGVVVLLHGGGKTRPSWARTGERLAASGWTAVALDARGHGDSEWDPGRDYTLDAFVDDLVAFVATLPGPPV